MSSRRSKSSIGGTRISDVGFAARTAKSAPTAGSFISSSPNELSRDEWLGLMLDREVAIRADKRVRNRLASARLRFREACIEDIDFAPPRGPVVKWHDLIADPTDADAILDRIVHNAHRIVLKRDCMRKQRQRPS